MGCYINPSKGSKELWLAQNATCIGEESPVCLDPSGRTLPVCLVDNGPFTAAGVCYDQKELDRFSRDKERRKMWFLVTIDKLTTVSDIERWVA